MDERSATVTYRIRFDEAGSAGVARPSLYLRLAQDAAWVHSERIGFTRGWYQQRGLAWLVRAVELDVPGEAGYGDEVAVTTTVLGFRRIWARRRTDVHRDGALVATVVTDWVLTDGQGRPARIPDAIARRIPVTHPTIEPIRVADPPSRPPDAEVAGEVRPSELDPLAHVNNAAYLDRVLDLGARLVGGREPPGLDLPSLALEYIAAAGPGDRTIESAWSLDGNRFAYRLSVADRGPILRARVTVPPRTEVAPAAGASGHR